MDMRRALLAILSTGAVAAGQEETTLTRRRALTAKGRGSQPR
jgi:hypothetical protein